MSVKALTREEFEAHQPARDPVASIFANERAWFADETETVLGVLLLDRADQDWAVVILGRDERGLFRAIETDVSVPDEEAARARLINAINRIASKGQLVFPQGD